MKTILKYLSIYKEFIKTSMAEQMSFRINFFLMILIDIIFMLSSLFTISFIYDHISVLGTWNKNHFLFFTSYLIVLDTIHMGIVASNFWLFSQDLKMGLLDFTLLKPVNIIFQIFFRYFRVSSLFTTLISASVLIYFGIQIELSVLSWLMLPIFILMSFILRFNLEVLIASLMFWIIEGNGINFFRMQLQEIADWPYFIYNTSVRIIFCFIFPILLIAGAPSQFLIDSKPNLIIVMFFSIIASSVAVKYFFHFALKRYESASS